MVDAAGVAWRALEPLEAAVFKADVAANLAARLIEATSGRGSPLGGVRAVVVPVCLVGAGASMTDEQLDEIVMMANALMVAEPQ